MVTHTQIANIYYTTKSVAWTIEVVQDTFGETITQADIVTAIRSKLADEFAQYRGIPFDYKPGLGRRVNYVS
jgi:hypothetical protein